MSKVKSVMMSFPASDSPDVVHYLLFMEEAPEVVDYDSPSWSLGLSTEIDLSVLDGMTTKDGINNLGVVAVDEIGNESSMSILEGVALDFEAPNPPGLIVIERS